MLINIQSEELQYNSLDLLPFSMLLTVECKYGIES